MSQMITTGTLAATAPFDFTKSLRFLAHFPPTEGEQQITPNGLTKAVLIDGCCLVFRLTSTGSIDQPEVQYTLFSDQPIPASVQQTALEKISFFLSLTDDLAPFYAIGTRDPCFAPIISAHYGLHHVKFLSLCEAACWAILTQHRAISLARKDKQALMARFGHQITVDGTTLWAFPERETLAEAGVDEIAALIHDNRRATYLVGLIEALGNIDENYLRTAPYEEAEAALRRIKGIGEWSAAFILLRALGRTERMLLNLKPFLNALPTVYGPETTMQQLSERYGHWFGYWGFYFRVAN